MTCQRTPLDSFFVIDRNGREYQVSYTGLRPQHIERLEQLVICLHGNSILSLNIMTTVICYPPLSYQLCFKNIVYESTRLPWSRQKIMGGKAQT